MTLTPFSNQCHFVFAGLGNPGLRYEMTRHNLGYMVVKAFAKQMQWEFKEEKRFNSLVVKAECNGIIVHLLMPLTFMNLSGVALRSYLEFYKLSVDTLVVITDDIALPFGQMRLKTMGSAGGHNGLKSIEQHFGTAVYKRLRMGISHPQGRNLADYVLEVFNQEEQASLMSIVDRGRDILLRLTKEDISQVMNMVNTVPRVPSKNEGLAEESIDLTKRLIKGEEITHESTKTKPL